MVAADERKKKVDEAAVTPQTDEAAAAPADKPAAKADKPAAKADRAAAKAERPAAKAGKKAAGTKAAAETAKPEKPAAAKPEKPAAAKPEKPAAAKPEKPAAAKPRKAAAEAGTQARPKPEEPAAKAEKRAAGAKTEARAPKRAAKPGAEKAARPKAEKRTARTKVAKAATAVAEAPVKAERPPRVKVERAVHEPRHGQPGVATVVDERGVEVGTRELAPDRFAVPADLHSLHLVVRAGQAARRRGTASTRTRGEISGSTAKLYRQKGTGRARAGSVKSPLRTGGGTVFGPKPRSYAIKVNRKVARKALAMALSDRAAHGDLFVAAGLELETPSTRRLNEVLTAIDCAAPVLVVTHDEPTVSKSVRNLFYAETAEVTALSTEQVLRARSLVLTEKAFDALNRG